MIAYAMILFVTAAVFAVVAVLIYRGRTDLIHAYHQTKVTDRSGYAKAMGKAMFVNVVSMAISGVIALLGESPVIVWSAITVLMIGLGAGIGCIFRVQKKYNGGVFG